MTDRNPLDGKVMPEENIQDVNNGAASSPAPTGDVNPSAAPSPAATPDAKPTAASSPAEGVKTKEAPTLKDRIAEGIAKITGKTPAKDTPAEAKTEPDQVKDKQAGEEDVQETDAEKSANDEWRNNPATKAILNERKQARAKATMLQKELETIKPDADQYRKIQTFLDTNGVKPADAANALKLTALAYTNPKAFYEKLSAMATEWGQHLGATLPADLQKDVDEGLITPERAKELAQARGQVRVAETQIQTVTERAQASDSVQEMAFRTRLFENWSDQVSKTDPDLEKKLPMITARLTQIRTAEGDPGSPQAAWERLNRALKDVNDQIRAFQPRPAIQPSPQSTGTPRGPASAPKTFDEAFKATLSKIATGGR
jgi:hypothetical protein